MPSTATTTPSTWFSTCSHSRFFRHALNPLGYAAPGTDADALGAALNELTGLVGEFEKPTYFRYDPNICAHGRSGIQGCRRCIDACPAGAIASLAEQIEVDPYRCLGGGSCASACPTGAITYRYPRPADSADRLRALLRAYREAGGEHPRLVFHDGKTPAPQAPANLLAVEVEEIGSVGLDLWLMALAYGARQVLLLAPHDLAAEVERELRTQLATCHALLDALGFPPHAVGLHRASAGELPEAAGMPENLTAAGFAGSNDKRAALFFALDWLRAQAETPADITELPATAPFGEVLVDQAACTLCMGCVSVCPAAALGAGGDTPRLDFVEANCVQCGMCQTACPEDAIRTHARFDFDRDRRRHRRVLNEEAPFCCIACGKPFATRGVIDKMTAKLAGHAMFQEPSALRRLQMCADCRVKDMFSEQRKLS